MKNICQNYEMLGDYVEGLLSDDSRSQMEEHLSGCDLCLQALIIAKDPVPYGHQSELADVPAEVTEAAVRLARDLPLTSPISLKERFTGVLGRFLAMVSDFFDLSTWIGRRLTPVRSSKKVVSKDLMCLKKSFNGIDIEIEIGKTGENNSSIRVRLINNIKGVRVSLLQEKEREVSSQLLNGTDVVFEDTPFGHYSLTFVRDGLKFGIYRLVIKERRHGRK